MKNRQGGKENIELVIHNTHLPRHICTMPSFVVQAGGVVHVNVYRLAPASTVPTPTPTTAPANDDAAMATSSSTFIPSMVSPHGSDIYPSLEVEPRS